ncbi:MAG: hypothetical protein U0183_22335 [Polyangiaceae bacterium]
MSSWNVRRSAVAVAGALVVLAGHGPAHADVLPRPPSSTCGQADSISACAGKKVGEACTYGSTSGACQALRCTNDAGETLLACSAGSDAPTEHSGGCSAGPKEQGGAFVGAFVVLGLATIAGSRRVRRR